MKILIFSAFLAGLLTSVSHATEPTHLPCFERVCLQPTGGTSHGGTDCLKYGKIEAGSLLAENGTYTAVAADGTRIEGLERKQPDPSGIHSFERDGTRVLGFYLYQLNQGTFLSASNYNKVGTNQFDFCEVK